MGKIINANHKEVRVRFSSETMNFSRVSIENEIVLQHKKNDSFNSLQYLIKLSDKYFLEKEKASLKEKIEIEQKILSIIMSPNSEDYSNLIKVEHLVRLMLLLKEGNLIEEAKEISEEVIKMDVNNAEAKNILNIYRKGAYYKQEAKATDFQQFLSGGGSAIHTDGYFDAAWNRPNSNK